MQLRLLVLLLITLPILATSQVLYDDFEGGGNVSEWIGDDTTIDDRYDNPAADQTNPSAAVLRYEDTGGLYANVRIQLPDNLDMATAHTFEVMVYVPSGSLSGDQPRQVSLKLQDGQLAEPWSTQCEIIKPIVLDTWQILTFNFATDDFINLNGGSAHPLLRRDFNRILLQVNGENNESAVTAFFDEFQLLETSISDPIYNVLVWSDEFDTDGAIDNNKWFHQTRIPNGSSWFNGEVQHYTDRIENSEVQDGILHIIARKERFTDQGQTKDYTSARLNSKFAFTYGRVDVRARVPRGVGTWPAIWMLGQNIRENGAYWEQQGFGTTGWPDCGEIDILEHWGKNQNFVTSAIHTRSSFGDTQNKGGMVLPTASDDFHIYSLVWTENELQFSVDGLTFYTYAPDTNVKEQWPFTEPQYLLLNLAIEPIIEDAFTEGALEIDYVRVYQESPVSNSSTAYKDVEHKHYPNPVSNDLTIETGIAGPITINVFSIDGILVASTKEYSDNGTVTIESLRSQVPGNYVVQYSVNNQTYSLQVIKQ